MATLYIIRGCSGSGKSTFAKTLADALKINYYEADMFAQNEEGEYIFDVSKLGYYHSACQHAVLSELANGWDVIVSNTSTTEKDLKPYLAVAKEFNAKVICLVAEHRHDGVNVHDVPEETLARQEQRLRGSIKLRG